MRKLIYALLALFALVPTVAQSRLTETAKVRYETQDGTSDWYSTDVTFLTGRELNQATTSFHYNILKEYAVVFWSKGQASVIQIDEPVMICGLKFDDKCLPILGRLSGDDQESRHWEICTALYC